MHKEFIRSNNVSNRSTSSNRPRLKEKWFPMTHPSWLPDTSSCCWTELCSVVDQVFRSANLNKTAKAAATDISDPCGALFCDSVCVHMNVLCFWHPARESQHRSALCSEQRVPGWNTSPTSKGSDDFGRIPIIPQMFGWRVARDDWDDCNIRRWAQVVNVQVTRVFSSWHETSLSARKL